MKSTIVIPNYNGIRYLENCLRSLQTEAAYVIVVDNGSSDGSYELIEEKFPQIETIRFEENTGFCKAVNAGIRASKTTYVILLNNDTIVESGFVQILENAMEKEEKVFSASAKMISMQDKEKLDDAGDLYCALGWAYAIGKGKPEKRYQRGYPIFSSCGGASIFRKSILEEIGLFDENHFAYLEDVDLGYRAQIYGYRNIFVPDARIFHAGSASSGSRYNKFKVDLTSKNSVYLIYKNMPFLQILLNLPFFLIGFSIKALFFFQKGFGKAYVTGLFHGICLCASKQGKEKKVAFQRDHFGNYCKIQLALWINMVRRLFL